MRMFLKGVLGVAVFVAGFFAAKCVLEAWVADKFWLEALCASSGVVLALQVVRAIHIRQAKRETVEA